jgi:hypothetical protein
MNKMMRWLIFSSIVTLLAACDDDNIRTPVGEKIPDGIYQGSWSGLGDWEGDLFAVILNNEAYLAGDISVDGEVTMDSLPMKIMFSVSDDTVTGQARFYYSRDIQDYGEESDSASVTGTVVADTLSIKITESDIIFGNQPDYQSQPATFDVELQDQTDNFISADLSRQNESDDIASIDKLIGDYTQSNFFNISVSDKGVITGSDKRDPKCDYEGKIEIPDSLLNIYKVNYEVTNCEYAGSYNGLGTLRRSDDKFVVFVSSAEYIFQSILEKVQDD